MSKKKPSKTKTSNWSPKTKYALTKDQAKEVYYYMRLNRSVEERAAALYRQGKIVGGCYSSTGNEAVSVATTYGLEKDDYFVPLLRNCGGHLVRGQTPFHIFSQYLGRSTSPTGGKDCNVHIGNVKLKIPGIVSHLSAYMPLSCGIALACKRRKLDSVVINYIGNGGSNVGEFHEALNLAAVWKLPFILIIENNQYAYSTPNTMQYACKDLIDRAPGYGIEGVKIDGTDAFKVYETTKWALERARAGQGPYMIQTETMRLRGHAEHDGHEYVPKKVMKEWEKKDPLNIIVQKIKAQKIMTDKELKTVDEKIKTLIESDLERALAAPLPQPEDAAQGVFADQTNENFFFNDRVSDLGQLEKVMSQLA
jgi:TPP-dependent pyruvate/acetoin dehydrogenase alpha subunit